MGAGPCLQSLPNPPARVAEGDGACKRETLVVSNRPPVSGVPTPQRRLVVQGTMRLTDGTEVPVQALIDTGAEVNLVRKGLVFANYFQPSLRPKRFVTADQAVMEGGAREVPCEFLLHGADMDTGLTTQVVCHTRFYDANIGVDAILSYEWLRQADIEIRCRRHGLHVNHAQGPVWIPGMIDMTQNDLMSVGINRVMGGPLTG